MKVSSISTSTFVSTESLARRRLARPLFPAPEREENSDRGRAAQWRPGLIAASRSISPAIDWRTAPSRKSWSQPEGQGEALSGSARWAEPLLRSKLVAHICVSEPCPFGVVIASHAPLATYFH